MRNKGRIVAFEFLSNCAVATVLAAWLDRALSLDSQPGAGVVLAGACCVASGAAHGFVANVLGRVLYGRYLGFAGLPQLSTPGPFIERTFFVLSLLLLSTLHSAFCWGVLAFFPAFVAYLFLVEPVARYFGVQDPAGLAAIGAVSGLFAGFAYICLVHYYVYRDQEDKNLEVVRTLLRHSNGYLLWQAKTTGAGAKG